jgi:hypothetical protein
MEDVFVTEWYFGQLEKRESLQAERIIISDRE